MERDVTLTCVSNPVGGRYIGNARWIGAPLADLLREAGVDPARTRSVSRSVDGFTVGTPTAVGHGRSRRHARGRDERPAAPARTRFPVRMIVPGLYGYVSATAWLVDIELTTFAVRTTPTGFAAAGRSRRPIKTESRIDLPKQGATVPAGRSRSRGSRGHNIEGSRGWR